MIGFSELRAQAWKYATYALGVLAVALLIVGLIFWVRGTRADARADAAEQRAEASEARVRALNEALARDGVSQGFTDTAVMAMDANAAETKQRLSLLERRLDGRPPVPAVCPSPAPEFLRESQEAGGRFRSAEAGLRDLRGSQGQPAN